MQLDMALLGNTEVGCYSNIGPGFNPIGPLMDDGFYDVVNNDRELLVSLSFIRY